MGFLYKGSKKRTNAYSDGKGYKKSSAGTQGYANNKILTKTSCHTCGKSCEVPFRPVAGKSVYCNDCFRKNDTNFKTSRPSKLMRPTNFDHQGHQSENKSSSYDLAQVNAKLDRILKILEP